MTPSVGRIVHYQSFGTPGGEYASQCRAAIVTEVHPITGDEAAQADIEHWDADQRFRVDLCVLNPKGIFHDFGLHQDESNKRGGTWHWPERVE